MCVFFLQNLIMRPMKIENPLVTLSRQCKPVCKDVCKRVLILHFGFCTLAAMSMRELINWLISYLFLQSKGRTRRNSVSKKFHLKLNLSDLGSLQQESFKNLKNITCTSISTNSVHQNKFSWLRIMYSCKRVTSDATHFTNFRCE